jgi:two-component system sensor histidine kinase CpxA
VTIFWRNFLSFWIATVLITLITVAMISMTHPPPQAQNVPLPLPALRACAEAHIRDLELGSSAQAGGANKHAQCGKIYILDKSNPERFGDTVPADVRSLFSAVTPEVPLSLRLSPARPMVGFEVTPTGNNVVAVAVLPVYHDSPPPFLQWQLAVAAVVSAFTCLVLTRHSVNPIRKLQQVTDSFGRGNLDSRPDASLLKRKDELGDLSNSIDQMSVRISTLMSSQKYFLTQVSHELGSPLTRLKLALALARRKVDGGLAPELDRIQHESSELNSMIQQLLKLARLDSGLEDEDPETYSLENLVQDVCADAQFIAEETGKHLQLSSFDQIEVRGYRELLKRALDNVLRNAIRFAPEGGCVDVKMFSCPDQSVMIHVRDAGVGVPDEKLEKIFEPFVRVSSTTDRAGAGLGLAIAKQAVLAHGGTIRALNLEEGGFLIEIMLPCVSVSDLEASLQDTAIDQTT